MALKSILVHVTNSDEAHARVDAALALALEHDAHITGLGVRSTSQIPGYAAARIPPEVFRDVDMRQAAELEAAHESFESAMTRGGWSERSGWLEGKGLPSDVVGLHARYADLTIIGQQPLSGSDNPEEAFADLLVMRSGRPVLVFPHIGAKKLIGQHVVVAWNASREAARAVGDAMPLLERSDLVEVLSIEPEGIGDLPGADIAQHLARHGIKADAKRSVANKIDAGDVLLNHVADSGADLVVMGAYGHSRVREMVLGGVTRHMLEHMTVPVLMSH
ncbi:MAG: universal stress protein [Alphaproteobacteria bacterium]|nr:universal stress protein [Alphaproteobacteria bacterium]